MVYQENMISSPGNLPPGNMTKYSLKCTKKGRYKMLAPDGAVVAGLSPS